MSLQYFATPCQHPDNQLTLFISYHFQLIVKFLKEYLNFFLPLPLTYLIIMVTTYSLDKIAIKLIHTFKTIDNCIPRKMNS